ncbi:MAG TPA: hypothetical protein VGL57_02135 [Solirubrobacteraceae bacterium]|jgi:Mrp family chromosome partitioning ATPase
MTPPTEDSYLALFARALRRWWPVVLACVIVAPGVAFTIAHRAAKEYSAKAEVLFRETHYEQLLFGSSSIPAPDPVRQAATNLKLVDLEAVSRRVGKRLGVSASAVREAISVAPQGEADIASVTATWGKASFAAALANTYVRQYIALSRAAEELHLQEAQRVVEAEVARMAPAERDSVAGHSLQDRASQLGTLAALQTGGAELASPAVAPSEPFAPNPKRDVILGIFLGLVLAIGLALLLDRLDRRLRTVDDIRRALRTPVLGSVPLRRRLKADGPLEKHTADVFRAMHANLRFFERDRELRSLMFASPGSGDGSSMVAWQLAAAAVDGGLHVLVIRADLRAASAEPGLTTALAHGALLQEVIVRGSATGGGRLDVLEPGPDAGSPMSLLASPRMAELLLQVREEYELVIVDAPPLGSVPDGIPLAKGVDGVAIVARTGAHSRRSLAALRAELDQLGVHVVGAIITGTRPSTERYGSVDLSFSLDPS